MVRKLLAAPAVAMILLAACGSDETTESTAAPTTPATAAAASETTAAAATETTAGAAPATTAPVSVSGMIQKPGECGLGTGEPATGEPIKLGGMATNVPGIDFTWIPKMASIYFDCVNANGGINGRPIDYNYFEEHVDAQEIASLATKLVEEDQVLGIVGNTSISECGVNGKYYTDKGYYAIIAGVSPDCFSQPNFSALNMGPYYSTLGGAQAAVNAGAKGKIVVVSPNQPGMDFNNSGAMDFGKSKGLEAVGRLEEVPFADPSGLAQALVAEAGDGGAVVLDFTGPTVVPLLQAIEQQGLVDKVIWASSTPPNDPSVATAVSSAWNDKFLINAEFNLLDSGEPDQDHMNALYDAAKPDFPISSFAQMGYLIGRATTEALLGITGDFTKETVNDAFKNIKGFTSDMLCKPWYYDSGVGSNVSNNSDRTVAPRDGKMVQIEDCFDIAALPGNPLDEIRANEG
jgi:branched-chain amino acid transport system substrate-binding protein